MKNWVNHCSETEMAYVAGLVDADGCLTIVSDTFLRPSVQVIMTDYDTIKWLADKFGTVVTDFRKGNKVSDYHKDQYLFKLSGKRCGKFCELISPHMITKKKQAEMVIAFCETYVGSGSHVPDEVWEQRRDFRIKIQELNQGG